MLHRLTQILIGAIFAMSTVHSGSAEAKFVFNQNHSDLEWFTIETDHFHVHYPVSKKAKEEGNAHALTAEWAARKMTKSAEEVWPKMCAEFNYFLTEKIHVVVLNQGDELQGFTIPAWDWVELSANPGGLFYRGRGRMEWFSDVFVHEFAHVVSLKANAAMAEGVQGVLLGGLYRNGINVASTGQRSVAVGAEMVLSDSDSVFWTEGGAEYWSDNTGYNWWTTSRDQNIRMSTLEDRLLEYDEWHTRFGKWGWGDSERYYQQGYNFGLYLRQRFGEDTYARFAIEHGRRWRWEWVSVVEDVLGLTAEELYDDWRAYITERYTAQYEGVKTEGEVVGRELLSSYQEWEFKSPKNRDEFMGKKAWEREKGKEGTGTYQFEPRASADGKHLGWLNRGNVVIATGDEGKYPNFTGTTQSDGGRILLDRLESTHFRADFEHGWDFVPGKDAVVVTGREDQNHQDFAAILGVKPDMNGYNWKSLWYYDMPLREKTRGNQTTLTRERKKFLGFGRELKEEGSFHKIPNTERSTDPSMSPDGETMAFFQYTDGTMNLATAKIDGSDKKHLTNFTDGTWLQVVDWSPDGEQLVLGIFRNYQQNLYIMNKDGTDVRPIMVDAWEELDAHWSALDGKIYFSADPTTIFNIFSYDPATGEFLQITNVIGGAQSPQVTPDGNLVYSYYTAHGWKIMGLAGDEFYNKPASHHFNTDFDEAEAAAGLAFEEDLSYYADVTRPYKAGKSVMAVTGIPMFRLENSGRADLGLSGGGQFYMQDYVEKHVAWGQGMLGEDTVAVAGYTYQGWFPNLGIGGLHYRGKSNRGYLLDEDEDRTTRDDQSIFELKNSQQQNMVWLNGDIQWNDVMTFGTRASWMQYSVGGTSSAEMEPYMHAYDVGLSWNFENARGGRSPNPSSGRSIEASWTHGWTDVTYAPVGGVAIDDGHILDNYDFNSYTMRWTELMQVPDFGIPALRKANKARHTLQVDLQMGIIDQNVDVNDEFRAGGQHPANAGYSAIQPNTQFAGYPGWSLSGETMAILNVAYRFPLNRYGYWRTGPITTNGIYMQMGGTAGNLWSYRPPQDESKSYRSQYDDRIAYDPDDVRREIPFVDEAYKNGNYMLYDAFAELRVASDFRDGMGWNSFLRLAYGFNEIHGYGDVDGDGIFDTSESGVGDELSAETEPAGWRLYLGLGTGW
jgi:hypothetical protein